MPRPKKAILMTALLAALMTMSIPVSAGELSWYDGSWPQDKSDVQPTARVHYGRLSNGLRWVIVPNARQHNRVSLYLNVQVGSLMEARDERGAAHFVEHMAFQGGGEHSAEALERFFRTNGMSVGEDANAYTGRAETVYKLNLKHTSPHLVKEALSILRGVADGIHFDAEAVARERNVILSEFAARNSEAMNAMRAWQRFLYGDSLLAQDVIGTEESLQGLDATELEQFYKKWYVPSRMVLIIAGDVSWQLLAADIEHLFGSIEERPAPAVPDFGTIDRFGERIFVQPRPITSAIVSISMLYATSHKPDTMERRREELVATIAQIALQRRLAMRAEHEPMLWSSATFINDAANPLMPTVIWRAKTDGAHWREALRALNEELVRARDFGLTAQELRAVKSEMSLLFKQQVKTSSVWSNEEWATALVTHINSAEVLSDPKEDSAFFEAQRDLITLDEVNTALKTLLSVDNRRLSISGAVTTDDVQVRQYWESIKNVPVAPPEEMEDIVFPYLTPPENVPAAPALVPKKVALDDSEVTVWSGMLANDTRVVLVPSALEKGRVTMEFNFGDGLMGVKDADALLARAAVMVLEENGVGRLSAGETRETLGLRDISVTEHITSKGNVIIGTGPADELKLIAEAVWTQFMDPTLTEVNQARAQQRLMQQRYVRENTVEGYWNSYLPAFLGGYRLRQRPIEAGELGVMSLARMRDYINAVRDRGSRSIVVSGSFQKASTLALLNQLFGTLPAALPGAQLGSAGRFPAKANRVVTIAEDRSDKAIITRVWHVEKIDFDNAQRTAARKLLAGILQERLRKALREEKGVSYSPSADYELLFEEGSANLIVSVQTVLANTALVEAALGEAATELVERGATEEELLHMRKVLLNQYGEARERLGFWTTLAREEVANGTPVLAFYGDLMQSLASLSLTALNKEIAETLALPEAQLTVKAAGSHSQSSGK